MNIDYDTSHVVNLNSLQDNQMRKMDMLREKVRELGVTPIEPAGSYMPMTFKSFDGGRFDMHFEPFEFEVVKVADSSGNVKMNFAAPVGDMSGDKELEEMLEPLNSHPVMRHFLDIMGKSSLTEISDILTAKGTLMEIAEFACIFDAIRHASRDNKTIILKDGLLRTKKIRHELIPSLVEVLHRNKDHVKVVGVAKTSKLVFLLQAALACEKIFPREQMGYVKIPLEIENMAYKWSGAGTILRDIPTKLTYSFGNLHIAKLSRYKDLFVTVELPQKADGSNIYSEAEATEIMSYLAKDAMYSYPMTGYPQTIMRAHESAAGLGIPASMLHENIIKGLVNRSDPILAEYIRNSIMLDEAISKEYLGGKA